MRVWVVAGMLAVAAGASAQDGARVTTIAKAKAHRAEWAGAFVRVENVTISDFSRARGALASDGTGRVRFDDVGMSAETIGRLERYCSGPDGGEGRSGCQGALEFTMPDPEGERGGGFTLGEANFIPED